MLLLFILLSGCNTLENKELTEQEAKQLVIKTHSRHPHAEIEVLSVTSKSDKYIIEWEIDPIEAGMDSVNKATGKLKVIESSRGSCKWK